MKYKILLTFILFLLIQAGWSADQKEKKGEEKNVVLPPNPEEGIVYALPRTVLTIKIKMVQESFRPGPYVQYAEKYLGYIGAQTTSSESWKIVDIDILPGGEADPDAVFKTFGPSATLASLYPDGTIAGVNIESHTENGLLYGNDNLSVTELPMVLYPDLSSNDQYDTEVIPETGEEKLKYKTLEDKAREAADYLFRLRQKRAYTILSPSDGVPEDGKAYEVFLQQVEKTSNEYLSLFLGKSFRSEHEFSITYTPGADGIKSEVLFRFSEDRGFLPKTDISGKPVTIDLIKDQKQYSAIESIYKPTGPNPGKSGLFYRIPVNATVSVSEGFNILFSGRATIAQFGLISTVPELLVNENTCLRYDRITGAIIHSGRNK